MSDKQNEATMIMAGGTPEKPEYMAMHQNSEPELVPGKHSFFGMLTWTVDDPTKTPVILQADHILSIYLACYWCEEQYVPGMETTECPGDVSAR